MTPRLTARQNEAMTLICQGLSIDQVADVMCISRSCAEKLLASARENLGAVNLRNAVYKAVKSGLIVVCCVAAFNADEARRHTRARRRDDLILLDKY